MFVKSDHIKAPETFYINDLSTPVYLQADRNRFIKFSYSSSFCRVDIKRGLLFNQQELLDTLDFNSNFFLKREAARAFIEKETRRYCTEEGYVPADWIPQELNNYLQCVKPYQGVSCSELSEIIKSNKTSYQLNQIANEKERKKLSTELNHKYFASSYVEKLNNEGYKGVCLVKGSGLFEEELEILKMQWRGNVLKIESERRGGKDYIKEFWKFESEAEALKDAEKKMKRLVGQSFKFKLEKFIPDFYEDESEMHKFNVIKPRNLRANLIKLSKMSSGYSCPGSQQILRTDMMAESPIESIAKRRYSIFPEENQGKFSVVDSKACKMVADFILEGLENRRKSSNMEILGGTETQGNHQKCKDQNSNQNQAFPVLDKASFRENFKGVSHQEENMCVICMDKATSMAFIPCGHKKTCEGCCEMVMGKDANCPVCRTGISSTLRIYE